MIATGFISWQEKLIAETAMIATGFISWQEKLIAETTKISNTNK